MRLQDIDHVRISDRSRDLQMVECMAITKTWTECAEPGCGYDETSRAGRNLTCDVCDGKGKIFTEHKGWFWARVYHYQLPEVWRAVVTTELQGDVFLETDQKSVGLLESVRDNDEGYVVLPDGRRIMIDDVHENYVLRTTGVVAMGRYVRRDR